MPNPPRRIGIIGGTGLMGTMFAPLFRADGYEVLIAGRRTELTYEALADASDVVIVTVPIENTAEAIARVAPRMRPEQLLTDFTSIKAAPVRAMLASRASVIGCHPVFGPVADPKGQNVVLCPARPGGFLPWFRRWFESHGMHVEVMDADAHDRAMGMIQGLLHFVNVSFARTLQLSGSSAEDLLKVSSPIYRIFFATVARILSGDPALYGAIQTDNAASRDAVRTFLREGEQILAGIERDDPSAFIAAFREAARYLGDTRREASAESARLIGQSGKPGKT